MCHIKQFLERILVFHSERGMDFFAALEQCKFSYNIASQGFYFHV